MTATTRPLLLGYLRAHVLMTTAEVAAAKDQLAVFAATEGYTLSGVYVEQADTTPAAFHALIEAIQHHDIRAVVVPSLAHLGGFGVPPTLKDHLEHYTRARVLVPAATP